MDSRELTLKKNLLESQKSEINNELKTVAMHQTNDLVDVTADNILKAIEEGKLDKMYLQTYLKDFTSSIRSIYNA